MKGFESLETKLNLKSVFCCLAKTKTKAVAHYKNCANLSFLAKNLPASEFFAIENSN